MDFLKRVWKKLTGTSSQLDLLKKTNLISPDYDKEIPEDNTPIEKKIYSDEELYACFDSPEPKYVSINKNILKLFKRVGFNLEGRDWKKFFSIAIIEWHFRQKWFSLNFPLFDRFIVNNGSKESKLSEKWKQIDPSIWHVPKDCIEPIDKVTDPDILLNL